MKDIISNGVTISVYLDARRVVKPTKLKEHETPKYKVKLRITHSRKTTYLTTSLVMTQDEWDKVHTQKPRQEYKKIQLALADIQARALTIAEQMPLFSFDEFKARFLGAKGKSSAQDVFSCIAKYREELIAVDRLNTADTYRYTLQSLQGFTNKKSLSFAEITPSFLSKYEMWAQKNKLSTTTVGMYLRNLRKIYNDAVANKIVPKEAYPFGSTRGLFRIPTGTGKKTSLNKEELKTLLEYEPFPNTSEALYFDIWRFSYYCNGINIKDICQLQYADIDQEQGLITFMRSKTKHTSRIQRPITAVLFEPTQEIITRHGTKPEKYENYVFPFFTEGLSAAEEKTIVSNVTKQVNKYIRLIGSELGIAKHITSYTARHTFAMALKRNNVSLAIIQDTLGHSSPNTTKEYLSNLDGDDLKNNLKHILLTNK